MRNDDRAIRLLERANPVPDEAAAEPTMTASQFLAQLDNHEENTVMLMRNQSDEHQPRFGDSNRLRRRVVPIAAAAAVVAVVVAGLIAIGVRDDADEVPAEPAPTTQPAVDDEQTPPTEPRPDAEDVAPVVPSDDAAPLPPFGSRAVPGTYWTFVLGVDIEFTLPRTLFVASNELGSVGLIDGYDLATGRYEPETGLALAFRRLAGWSTREEAVSRTPAGSIDPYDLDAWVAANDVTLLSDTTTEISGRSTRVVDVQVDPTTTVQAPEGANGCFAGWEPCFHYGLTAPATTARKDWISGERITRFYLIEIDDSEPILVEVGAPPGSDFFDEIETTVIASLVIGDDAPPHS